MDLSIIILNYKTKGLVKYCIKNAQTAAQGLNYEIIVVDNGSKDGCQQMIAENFPEIKFIQTGRNLGFAAGSNVGIKAAQGRYVMLLNPDVTALGDSIKKMYDFMESRPEVGVAGPRLLNPDRSFQPSARTFQTLKIIIYRRTPLGALASGKKALSDHLYADWNHETSREVDWVMGACLLARKEALDKVGLLDERFFFYVEDMDWCRRFWQKGYKVFYIADAQMVHLYEGASKTDPWEFLKIYRKTTRWHFISGIKYFLKYLKMRIY